MNHLSDYLPIIFAVIYVIISIVGKVQKKGKQSPPPASDPRQGMTWEDMEREYGITIEREDTSRHDEYLSQDDWRRNKEALAAEKATQEAADRDELSRQRAIQRKLARRQDQTEVLPKTEQDPIKAGEIGSRPILSRQSLREGIQWSMILDKPKALKR